MSGPPPDSSGPVIAGFEFRRPTKPPRPPIPQGKVRADRLDADSVKWILGRAAAFVQNGGLRRPAWTWPAIARNLKRARGPDLGWRAVRSLVKRADPGLFAARKAAEAAYRRPRCVQPCPCACHKRKKRR
jgi:hypothetical protein